MRISYLGRKIRYEGGGGERTDGGVIVFAPGDGVVYISVQERITAKTAVVVYGVENGVKQGGIYLIDLAKKWGLEEELRKLLDSGVGPAEALKIISQKLGETAELYADRVLSKVYFYGDPPDVAYAAARDLGRYVEYVVYLGWLKDGRVYEYEPLMAVYDKERDRIVSVHFRAHYVPVQAVPPIAVGAYRDPTDRHNHILFYAPPQKTLKEVLEGRLAYGLPAEPPIKNPVGYIVMLPENYLRINSGMT